MITNYISGLAVIQRVDDDFNIKTSDWKPLAPDWIFNALRSIRVRQASVEAKPVNLIVKDNRFDIPDYCSQITKVLDEQGLPILVVSERENFNTTIQKEDSITCKRCTVLMNECEINTDDEFVTVFYRKYPTHYSKELMQEIPIIPDSEIILEGLSYYVLSKILGRGYVHPIYKLGTNNQNYDPRLVWESKVPKIRKVLNSMTDHDYELIARDLTTFFVDKASYYKIGYRNDN